MKQISLAVLGVALLSTQAFGQLGQFYPRSGDLSFTVFDSNYAIVVADSNEEMLVSPLSVFDYQASIMTPASDFWMYPPVLRPVTEAPQQLDNGDYAIAVGLVQVLDPSSFVLKGFMQLRLQGSTATALTGVAATPFDISDPSNHYNQLDDQIVNGGGLAAMAVAAGLWSSPNDYFEFSSHDAFVHPAIASPAGPQDWVGSVMPEPGTAALVACALLSPALRLRRR